MNGAGAGGSVGVGSGGKPRLLGNGYQILRTPTGGSSGEPDEMRASLTNNGGIPTNSGSDNSGVNSRILGPQEAALASPDSVVNCNFET